MEIRIIEELLGVRPSVKPASATTVYLTRIEMAGEPDLLYA